LLLELVALESLPAAAALARRFFLADLDCDGVELFVD